MEDTVIIKRSEYDQLVKDSNFLQCLDNAGVDNWDGYNYAVLEFLKEFGSDDETE